MRVIYREQAKERGKDKVIEKKLVGLFYNSEKNRSMWTKATNFSQKVFLSLTTLSAYHVVVVQKPVQNYSKHL